ncbi:MAG: hypothetical protein MHM6MM_001505 [Cercozoa sp. M6MM]
MHVRGLRGNMGNKQSTGLADKLAGTHVITDEGDKYTIVQVVQTFWFDVVEEKRSEIALELYNGLFSAHPEYLSVFGTDGSSNRQRAEAQMSRLIHMLSSFVQNLADLEHLDARVKEVGRLHANIDLPVAAYAHLTDALCDALKVTVPHQFTPRIAFSLKEVLNICGCLMAEEQMKHEKKFRRRLLRRKARNVSPSTKTRALRHSASTELSYRSRSRKSSGALSVSLHTSDDPASEGPSSLSTRRVSLASTLSSLSMDSEVPPSETENLLRDDHFFDFLQDARCLSYFQLFMARELASENLMFYRDVTRWSAVKEVRRRVEEAWRIFDDYIPHDARSYVLASLQDANGLGGQADQYLARVARGADPTLPGQPVACFDTGIGGLLHIQ